MYLTGGGGIRSPFDVAEVRRKEDSGDRIPGPLGLRILAGWPCGYQILSVP